MKKTFGISLVAMMMAMPMMAHAVVTDADPGATTTGAPTATNAPKYTLKPADNENDGKAATAGYVKGAYNAIIKGVNKTQDEVGTLNTGIATYANAIDHLTDGKATKAGTVATIKSATSSETINGSSVNFTGVTTTSISATASGNVNLSVPVMGDWETNAPAANPVQTTTTFSGLTVNNLSMSAPTSNTTTLTKTGIAGTVNVVEYLAPYDFTPLINTNGDSYIPDGNTWTTTWNKYGTARGTSMCSSTGNDGAFSMGQTTTEPLSTSGDKKSCWCKMTGFTDNNNTTHNDTSLWVFSDAYSSAADCAGNCADGCGDYVRIRSAMRSGLFGSVQ